MSKICDLCKRKPQVSIKRSHSHIATKRKQGLNLHTVKIKGKKMRICNRCFKKIKRNSAQ